MTPQQKLAAFIRDTGVEDLAEEIGIELPSKTDEWLNKFITCNSKLLEIKDRVRKLSKTDFDNINVLITGETGTGKELKDSGADISEITLIEPSRIRTSC